MEMERTKIVKLRELKFDWLVQPKKISLDISKFEGNMNLSYYIFYFHSRIKRSVQK